MYCTVAYCTVLYGTADLSLSSLSSSMAHIDFSPFRYGEMMILPHSPDLSLLSIRYTLRSRHVAGFHKLIAVVSSEYPRVRHQAENYSHLLMQPTQTAKQDYNSKMAMQLQKEALEG